MPLPSPSIAVILPTRNRETWLKRTLSYLEAQTYKNFVVRVSDNGSSDATKHLSAKDFPNLNIIWTRRDPPLPGLAEHYQQIVSECVEDYIAVAHDDEIYSKDWLQELVSLLDDRVTVAFGRALNVDARSSPWSFQFRHPILTEGSYPVAKLKEELSLGRGSLCGNGFLLKTQPAKATLDCLTKYEQYDYEWIIRVAESGLTQVSPRYLNTQTIHQSNTLSSAEYLAELGQRIHACSMMQEWLEKTDLSQELKKNRHQELARMRLGGLRQALLRAALVGSPKAIHSIAAALIKSPGNTPRDRLLAATLCQPWILPLTKTFGTAINLLKKYRTPHWPNPVDSATLQKIFPECLNAIIPQNN